MRVFNVDGDTAAHTDDELESFSLRSNVQAVECPTGAAITDGKGDTLASTDRPCYVVVDGNDYQLVPAVLFDSIYTEGGSGATVGGGGGAATSGGNLGPAETDPAVTQALQAIADQLGTLNADVDALKAQQATTGTDVTATTPPAGDAGTVTTP